VRLQCAPDESALDEYNEWKQQPDFWHVGKDAEDDQARYLNIPAPFQSDVQARHEDAELKRRGQIGRTDEEQALETAQQAAKAHREDKRVDPEKARTGDATAQYNLGVYLAARASADAANLRRAVGWFQKAARQHHSKAQYNLALCLLHGTGAPTNQTAALALLSAAARQGHLLAEYQRALLYLHGLPRHRAPKPRALKAAASTSIFDTDGAKGGAPRERPAGSEGSSDGTPWILVPDARRALRYLARAAGGEITAAQRELARCCLHGVGMAENPEAAVTWLQKAAGGGDALAMVDLARLLLLQAAQTDAGGDDAPASAGENGRARQMARGGGVLPARSDSAAAAPPAIPGPGARPRRSAQLIEGADLWLGRAAQVCRKARYKPFSRTVKP
jgi:TPR repeat protein